MKALASACVVVVGLVAAVCGVKVAEVIALGGLGCLVLTVLFD